MFFKVHYVLGRKTFIWKWHLSSQKGQEGKRREWENSTASAMFHVITVSKSKAQTGCNKNQGGECTAH